MLDRLRLHRPLLLVGGALIAGLLLLLGLVAVAVRLSTARPSHQAVPTSTRLSIQATAPPSDAAVSGTPEATDVPSWNALAPVVPATSPSYPAIAVPDRQDPDAFTRAFVTELFTRNYRASTRAQLISWAQYEDAPLRSTQYPPADWSKVLVDSLTDLTWDDADDTPIPADGPWLALRSEQAQESVSDVTVSLDPQWEQQIASGYQPPDSLATVRDVTFTITQHASAGGSRESTFSVALAVQLGSSPRDGGYGVAATNNYVVKEVS